MIEKLYKNIAAGLKAVRPCKVYVEDVPQNFAQPSFLITFYEQEPSRGINGRLKNSVRIDVLYFRESENEPFEECWRVGEDLSREFAMTDFKIRNRGLKIVDNVLHFLFDVDYREYLPDERYCPEPISISGQMSRCLLHQGTAGLLSSCRK